MGMEITIRLDEAASERVRSVMAEGAQYDSIESYVAELIQRDAADAFNEFETVKAELRRAFAAPEESYVRVTADDILARNGIARPA